MLECEQQRARLGRLGRDGAQVTLDRHGRAVTPLMRDRRESTTYGQAPAEHAGGQLAVSRAQLAPPSLEHGVVVGARTQVDAACEAFVVDEADVAAIDHALPSAAHPQAQIDVLEAIHVRLVEAAELEEQPSPDREARPGDSVEIEARGSGRQVACLVVEEVLGHRRTLSVGDPHDAGVLDRSVREQQPRARSANPVLRGGSGDGLDRSDHELHVVVEKHQHFAGGGSRAGVAPAGEVEVRRVANDRRAILPGVEKLAGVVRRGVVDEDKLDLAAKLAPERPRQAREPRLGDCPLAVEDDHERDCRVAHAAARTPAAPRPASRSVNPVVPNSISSLPASRAIRVCPAQAW